jgi:hypothetical protein
MFQNWHMTDVYEVEKNSKGFLAFFVVDVPWNWKIT